MLLADDPSVLAHMSYSCHRIVITGSLFWGKCYLEALVMKRCSQMAGLSHCPSNVSLCPVLPGRERLQPFVLDQLLQIYLGISLLSYHCACPFPYLSALQKQKYILLKEFFSNAQHKNFAHFTGNGEEVQPR